MSKRKFDTFDPGLTWTRIRARKCQKAADMLMEAFCWFESKEGDAYWSKVHSRLEEIAAAAQVTLPPSRVRKS